MLQSSMANYTHGLWRILLWLAAHNSAQLKYYNGHLSSCAPVHSSELQSHIAQHTPTMVFYLCFSLSLSTSLFYSFSGRREESVRLNCFITSKSLGFWAGDAHFLHNPAQQQTLCRPSVAGNDKAPDHTGLKICKFVILHFSFISL